MELTTKQKAAFGIGAVGKDMVYALSASYVMYYYQDILGLPATFVGLVLMIARVFDAFNDPFMGVLVAKTRTRWGRFRPWIFTGTVLNAAVLYALFAAPVLAEAGMMVYFSVIYILWGVTYTMMDIPYWSMLPSLSKTKEERDQMSVIPRIFASLAWLLMGAFAIKMVSMLGNGDDAKGYSMLAVGIAVIFVVTSIITVVFVKDRSCFGETGDKKAERTTVKDALHVIMANDQLKVFIGVVLCYNLVVQLAGGVAIYYFTYVAGDKDLYPIFTTAAQFAEIGALFLFPVLSKRLSKKQVFAIASFSPAIGLVGLVVSGFFAPQNVVIIAVCGVLYKLGSGLTLGATTVMLADVIDYGQVKLGSRNESIIASFQTLLVKTASAVSAWLIGVGLTIVGYVANTEQSAATIMGMRVLMGVIPAVITVLAFVIYVKGYKLDGAFLEEILSKVNKSKKTEV